MQLFEIIQKKKMYNKRANNLKETQEQNRKLEEDMKRMEEELERIKKLKMMELEKERLRLEMQRLTFENEGLKIEESATQTKKSETNDNKNLRNYGQKVKQETSKNLAKKIKKKKIEISESSNEEDDNDTENLKYFMQVVGFPQYFDKLLQNNIKTMPKLRNVDEATAKKIGIPLKDMVKINKKLRSMGY